MSITKTRISSHPGGRQFIASTGVKYALEVQSSGRLEPSTEEVETITYSEFGRGRSNTCSHTISGISGPYMGTLDNFNTKVFYDDHVETTPWKGGMCRWYTQSPSVLNPSDEAEVQAQDALSELLAGGIKPSANIPLMILELRDVPGTVKQFLGGLSSLRRLLAAGSRAKAAQALVASRSSSEYLRRLDRSSLRSSERDLSKALRKLTVKEAAKSNLWYQFGVKPLFSDLPKMYGELERMWLGWDIPPVTSSAVRLRVPFGLPSELHLNNAVTGWSETYSGLAKPSSSGGITVAPHLKVGTLAHPFRRVTVNNYEGVYYGELVEPFKIADVDRQKIALQMGGGLSATTWESLPFSFVIDMFADLGKLIAQAKARQVAVDMNLGFREGIWLSGRRVAETWLQNWVPSVVSASPDSGGDGWHNWSYSVTRGPWILEARLITYGRDKVQSYAPGLSVRTRLPNLSRLGTLASLAVALHQNPILR